VLAYALGISHLDLPLIGTFGFVDGRLLIPFIGNFRLEAHDVSRVYWDNFFTMGSWNLFWLAVAGGLVTGALFLKRTPGRHARRTALSLILVFIAVQWFIFGFTDQGLWASKYTAINRLPIHFVPALLFAVMMVANAGMTQYAGTAGDTNGLYNDS
jgi:heme exporter protein D